MLIRKINRINEDIARVMSTLLRELKDPRVRQGMISVTAVDTTTDLKQAKVYLSCYDIDSETQLMKGLKSASGHLRSELARTLGLRNTPELIFEMDDSIQRGSRINMLLSNMDINADVSGGANTDVSLETNGNSDTEMTTEERESADEDNDR